MPRKRKSGNKLVMLSFRVECDLERMLRKFVHDRRQQKYLSTGQVMRDALWAFLKEESASLAKSGIDEYSIEFALFEAGKHLDESMKQRVICEEFMHRTQIEVDALSKTGISGQEQLGRLLAEAKQKLSLMPDNFWTRRLRQRWIAAFDIWIPDALNVSVAPDKPKTKVNGAENPSERISMRPDDFEQDEAEE